MVHKIAQVVVGLPVEGPFDYSIADAQQGSIREGQRVAVSFHNQRKVGFVVGFRQRSHFKKLKPVLSVLDNAPVLDAHALNLTKQFSDYYGCSWGEAIETSLPNVLRTKKTFSLPLSPVKPLSSKRKSKFNEVILCHDKGVTQRWPFIMTKMKETLAAKKGILFLVPEVTMIPKVQAILKEHLDLPVAVLDKKLTPKKEGEQWVMVKEGTSRIVLGTRSAVFAPVMHLGLIIIYEEENAAYKQEQSPFYHAREIVQMRSKIEGSSLLFVSSAPSAEMWWNVKKLKADIQTFESGQISKWQMIDLSNYKSRKRAVVSFPLSNDIQEALSNGKKVVLFLNRRGFSTLIRCQCGYTAQCERCGVNLTYVYAKKQMVCYLCKNTIPLMKTCPRCHKSYLRYFGRGSEKIESELARIFPQARISRFDRETKAIPRQSDIIIATQAVLKVLDQIQAGLIGVLEIDAELNRFDFRSAQKVFSLLIHLRQAAREKIVVQTYHVDNYSLKAAGRMDFKEFYENEIKLRRELDYPPFSHLVAIGLRGKDEEIVCAQAVALYERLKERKWQGGEILEPQPDITPKLRDQYRFTIMIKGRTVKRILQGIKASMKGFRRKNVIVTVNVDP